MKKIFTLLIVIVGLAGCSYDDSDLWNKVDDLDSRLKAIEQKVEEMNSDISAIQTIVDAFGKGKNVTDVQETAEGIKITMSDGSSFTVKHGTNGQDATNVPIIGVKLHTDGEYYWTITIDGVEKWLPNNDTPALRVTGEAGAAGHTPAIAVDSNGFWTLDGEKISDGNGGFIKASGEKGADGTDGDSFFQDVDASNDDYIIFTLQNGTTFNIPRSNSRISFENGKKLAIVAFGQSKDFDISLRNIDFAQVLSAPDGWGVAIDLENAKVTITAPDANVGSENGVITIVALDSKQNTLMAIQRVQALPDFTDPAGAFIVNEGNAYSQNGTVIYYDGQLNEHRDVFQKANDGMSPGNSLQDMFIADGKIYLVAQKENTMGGKGRLMVCDAATLQVENIYELNFARDASSFGHPQHLVVAGNKVFIQYVDQSLEKNSGIRVFDLSTGTLKSDDIEGTYGTFGSEGALKAKMLYSKGQIVACLPKSLVFIDPQSEAVSNKIDFNGLVKDVVKGADGNLYAAVTGDLDETGNTSDESKIVSYAHDGTFISSTTLTGIEFPVTTWSPNVAMNASFTNPYIYFIPDEVDFQTYTGMDHISRFDYSTGTVVESFVKPQTYSYVYGYSGEHPTTGNLFVTGNPNYSITRVTIYDITGASPSKVKDTRFNNYTASPAGVFFTYSFSQEYINR